MIIRTNQHFLAAHAHIGAHFGLLFSGIRGARGIMSEEEDDFPLSSIFTTNQLTTHATEPHTLLYCLGLGYSYAEVLVVWGPVIRASLVF